MATLSTGEQVIGPKRHRVLLKRQRRWSRSRSRQHQAAKQQFGLAATGPIPNGVQLSVSENAK